MRKFAVAIAYLLAAHAADVAQSAGPPFKIGLILDMSGPYAHIAGQGSVVAARMAVEDFGGKVLGRPIEVVFADHQNKADIAALTAREWFDEQGVEAVMDVATSAPALAANEIAKARNKIMIFNGTGALRLTNDACGPYSVHYAYDTYSMVKGTVLATVKQGSATWYLIVANYPYGQDRERAFATTVEQGSDTWYLLTAGDAFGPDVERDIAGIVKANGGTVVDSVRHPLNTSDFSPYLLQAQASKAKVIGLANSGTDAIKAINQASELRLADSGQQLAGLLVFITEIDSLGLNVAQGMLLTEAFYWDANDEARAWSRRFFEQVKRMPTMAQAGAYSATMHYLKAVAAAKTAKSEPVMKEMRATPINDFFAKNGRIREDGRMVHDMYLFEVKTPAESKERWDYYKLAATIPGGEAFKPLSESECPLVKRQKSKRN